MKFNQKLTRGGAAYKINPFENKEWEKILILFVALK